MGLLSGWKSDKYIGGCVKINWVRYRAEILQIYSNLSNWLLDDYFFMICNDLQDFSPFWRLYQFWHTLWIGLVLYALQGQKPNNALNVNCLYPFRAHICLSVYPERCSGLWDIWPSARFYRTPIKEIEDWQTTIRVDTVLLQEHVVTFLSFKMLQKRRHFLIFAKNYK